MEFSHRASVQLTNSTGQQDTSGSISTTDYTKKIVYAISQDNIRFYQTPQPPSTVTELQITKVLVEKQINETKEAEKVVDCKKLVSKQLGNVPENQYLDYSRTQSKVYKINRFFTTLNSKKCPLDYCSIRTSDCTTRFTKGRYIRFYDSRSIFIGQD